MGKTRRSGKGKRRARTRRRRTGRGTRTQEYYNTFGELAHAATLYKRVEDHLNQASKNASIASMSTINIRDQPFDTAISRDLDAIAQVVPAERQRVGMAMRKLAKEFPEKLQGWHNKYVDHRVIGGPKV
jgi:hypothetical protein